MELEEEIEFEDEFDLESEGDETFVEESHLIYIENLTKHQSLIYKNYHYKWQRKNSNSVYWKCKECNTFMLVSDDGDVLSEPSDDKHTCNPLSNDHIECLQVESLIKNKVLTTITPIQEIYEQELVRLAEIIPESSIATYLPQYEEIKANLYRIRKRNLPTLPITSEDIVLTGEWTQTISKQQFLLFDTGAHDPDRLICFCSNSGLSNLSSAKQWHVDATFHASTKQFYQLLIIHSYQDIMLPCAYVLMKRKTYLLYKSAFDHLKEKAAESRICLEPNRIICDFELALLKCFKFHFPTAEIKGCQFHFSQCIWNNVQSNGLKTKYCKNEKFKKWIKKLVGLSFCPENQIQNAFDQVSSDKPEVVACNKMIKYFHETWMIGQYPLSYWNHSKTVGPRTNNHIEGFHSKFNRIIGHSKPNIFKLISLFKRFESLASVRSERLTMCQINIKRKRIYDEKDKKIKCLLNDFDNKLISLVNLIDKLGLLMCDQKK